MKLIYEILHNIEKNVPHNMTEARSKVLVPTYRFVTSANFILGIIVMIMILAVVLIPYANAYEQEVIDRNGIKNIVATDLNHNATSVIFEYCSNKYTQDTVGALVTSELDAVPVPMEIDNIQYRKCAIYGTSILAESDTVGITLFEQNRVDAMIHSFNTKIHDLKNALTSTEQKINNYKKIGYDDKIHPLEQQSKILEKQIKSAQSGLKTLIAMKNS